MAKNRKIKAPRHPSELESGIINYHMSQVIIHLHLAHRQVAKTRDTYTEGWLTSLEQQAEFTADELAATGEGQR